MSAVLVACVGNLFLGDDGFGCEVARRLLARGPRAGVVVRDFGIGTIDLMYELERSEVAIVVDVVARGAAPGTLHTIEPIAGPGGPAVVAAHAATATDVVRWAARRRDGGQLPRSLRLIGCEPLTFGDEHDGGALGLSPAVSAAVDPAVELVLALASQLGGGAACTSSA